MKFLKYLLFFILGLFLLTVIIGLIFPKFNYSNEVVINKPVEKVWNTFMDETKTSQWLDGYQSSKIIKGNHLEVGCVSKMKFISEGEQMEFTETITAIEPNKRFAFDMDAGVFLGHTEITLTPQGNGTKLTATNLVDGNNVMYDAMFYFFKNTFKENGQKSYDNLKALVEGQ